MYQLPVVIEKDEDGYYAYCPVLDGCQTQGDTYEEILINIKEAISLYISTLSETEKYELLKKDTTTMLVGVQVA
ncbi:MAG: type II toxin-antitoxin system HicB family antitoxin [Coleofasciculaceae cyanobacterium SM2_1_6]|nr:type II toxin-antitoxin system HicB family antitoxin [Coleofasciculaceae cyanobacterium SM2_1_6]